MIQGATCTVIGLFGLTLALLYAFCMIQVPIAAVFGFTIYKGTMIPCVVGWGALAFFGGLALIKKILAALRPKLDERHERKLSLIEQRIKDGKEGICTIVEVV